MKAYFKICRKMFTHNIFRFISIVLITILGTAFFVGMNSVAPAMKEDAEKYLKDQEIYDFSLVSNLGYKDEDIEKFKENENVKEIEGTYTFDALLPEDGKDITARLLAKDNNSKINKFELAEGRDIENDDECLIDNKMAQVAHYKIGDTIELFRKDDVNIDDYLEKTKFKVVGITRNPAYMLKFYGNTELLNGELETLITINKNLFKSEYYTNVYIQTGIDKNTNKFSDEYEDKAKEIREELIKINDEIVKSKYDKFYEENKKKIDDYKILINNSDDYLDSIKQQLQDGQVQINSAIIDFATPIHQDVLINKLSEVNGKYNELTSVKKQKKEAQEDFDSFNKEVSSIKKELDDIDFKIEKNLSEIYLIEDKQDRYIELNKESNKLSIEYNEKEKIYNDKNTILAEKQNKLNDLTKRLEELKSETEEKQNDINKSFKDLNTFINSLNSDEIKIGYNQIDSKLNELENNKQELADKNYDKIISDAKDEVNSNEKDLNNFEGIADVQTLNDNSGFKSLKNDLDKIAIMGRIFPVMFFIVAALVTMTTVQRMIEEDRKEIGTLKALGYSNGIIISRYVLYSFFATLIGIAIGTVIGSGVIVNVLFLAYGTLYDIPDIPFKINLICLLLSTVISMITTVFFAFIITKKSLSEKTADLMRQKVEKTGKGILLEKIPFIWNKFGFLRKICFRNIFRYKRRLFMTLIGISGCTMLIYTGLCLKSSIDEIGVKQFSEIKKPTGEIIINNEEQSKADEISEYIKSIDQIKETTPIKQSTITVEANDYSKEVFYIAVDGKEVDKYIKLENRKTSEKIQLDDNGVVVTEKLAGLLNVKKGDKITIKDSGISIEAKVNGVTENYLYNYIYMTPKMYKKIYSKDIKYNEIFFNTKEVLNDETSKTNLSDKLKENDKVQAVIYTSQYNELFNMSLRSLMSIVFLFVGCASLLSFTVLINLNNINIEERKRELATFKVLGFYKNELQRYVFRENIILTLLGTFFGLIIGIAFLGVVTQSAEVETIFLPKEINYINLAISAGLTILFTLITNLFMKKKIKNIDMIDSLKSIE